jgi:DNA-binding phage protein
VIRGVLLSGVAVYRLSSVTEEAETNRAIAAAVDLLAQEKGVNVEQLAVYAGLNRSSLYRKLKGEYGWKAADVAALAKYFGVQPGDLFTGADGLRRKRRASAAEASRRPAVTRPAQRRNTHESSRVRHLRLITDAA